LAGTVRLKRARQQRQVEANRCDIESMREVMCPLGVAADDGHRRQLDRLSIRGGLPLLLQSRIISRRRRHGRRRSADLPK